VPYRLLKATAVQQSRYLVLSIPAFEPFQALSGGFQGFLGPGGTSHGVFQHAAHGLISRRVRVHTIHYLVKDIRHPVVMAGRAVYGLFAGGALVGLGHLFTSPVVQGSSMHSIRS
jgi:hypothetical protein